MKVRRALLLLIACSLATYALWPTSEKYGGADASRPAEVPTARVDAPVAAGVGAELLCVVNDKLRSGESMYDLLMRHGIAPRGALEIGAALKPHLPPDQLWPQDRFRLWMDPTGALSAMDIVRSPMERYRVEADGDRFLAGVVPVPVDTVMRVVWGQLDDNLWNSFTRAGTPPQLIVAFTEIFAWSVDFFRDAQSGDAFGVYFPDFQVQGQSVATGDIEAAFYVRGTDTLWAFGFADSGPLQYYDREGNSLKKALMRAPLKFSRVSSGFSRRRLHPVYKVVRPHNGVDYAARSGTPVYAAGDGQVRYAGWKKGLGRCVEIRHPNGYRTVYGHLSAIANGVHSGATVQQRDRIGSVGQTGNATAPHLHYEVWQGNRAIDPRALKLPARGPVADSLRPAFDGRRDRLLREVMPPYGPLLARIG